MWPNPQKFPVDLVTFTEEDYNGKLYFLCSDGYLNVFMRDQTMNQVI